MNVGQSEACVRTIDQSEVSICISYSYLELDSLVQLVLLQLRLDPLPGKLLFLLVLQCVFFQASSETGLP